MTKQQKTKKLILVIFLLFVCFVLIRIYQKPKEQIPNPIGKASEPNRQDLFIKQVLPVTNNSNLEFTYPKGAETTVYDFMLQLAGEEKMNFKTKTYVGLGEMVTEINGTKNAKKNWIFYVNREKAQIGISNYKIKPGDVVSWKYEDSY